MKPVPNRDAHHAPLRGVHYGRRHVMQLGCVFGALPLLETIAGRTRAPRPLPARAGGFEAFAEVWRELHSHYINAAPMEDAYLYRLAAEAKSLDPTKFPPMRHTVFENERISTGPAWSSGSIFAVVVKMAPGAILTPHDHPGHVVVTMGLQGSATYAHYEVADEPPAKEDHTSPFLVRRTREGILTPGRTTHLSRSRDNLHTFTAGPKGAVLVDFTTAIGGPNFGMLAIDETPEDAFDSVYIARWKEVSF